ncbi:hypothetical protein [Neobacillus sp. 114]|uniref:hypothetical protein n=1 Tax=Neobacillus sp. 114 TaxID=3048535 RepID=UPI0024C22FAF|nr:hypothetical protein [Neobacillus sp. 114]
MFKWITKKDLTYWIIIIISIWLLTSNYDVTLSKWSFAGTIISIILAVLAIIYSFDQSSTTLYSTRKLEDSAKQIENVTKILQETSINDLFINLEKKIESLNGSLDESMNIKLKEHQKGIESIINSLFKKNNASDFEVFSKDEWKKYLQDYFSIGTVSGLVLLYIYQTYKNQVKLDFELLGVYIANKSDNKQEREEYPLIFKNVFHGAYTVFSSLNVCDESVESKMIIQLSPNFEIAMDELMDVLKENTFVKDICELVELQKSH